MTFDPKKPVQTRDGRSARIIATDRVNSDHKSRGIVALIMEEHGNETVHFLYDNGRLYKDGYESNWDLVNITTKRVMYGRIYRRREFTWDGFNGGQCELGYIPGYLYNKPEDVPPKNSGSPNATDFIAKIEWEE